MLSKISKTKQKHSWQFDAIGTKWSIETTEPLQAGLRDAIEKHIGSFDVAYSRFRDDSIVSEMAGSPGAFTLPANGKLLGELYEKLYAATNGAMSPLVGASLNSAGYDKDYSFSPTGARGAPEWHDAMTWQGRTITTTQPIELDVGAAGKGLLVDEITAIIQADDIHDYVIDASGDIREHGRIENVGLENPFDPESVIGAVNIEDESLCASAMNRRKWVDGWHHVLDARTGKPVRQIIATWVIAESTMLADGLATALFFVPADRLRSVAEFEYVRLHADGTVEYSKRFVGQLFL